MGFFLHKITDNKHSKDRLYIHSLIELNFFQVGFMIIYVFLPPRLLPPLGSLAPRGPSSLNRQLLELKPLLSTVVPL